MAEAGCLYHTSWIIDYDFWLINVRGGQKFIDVLKHWPNQRRRDARLEPRRGGLLPADDPGPVRHARSRGRGERAGHVPVTAPPDIGRPNAAKHLDEALRDILGHDGGTWATTADDIAEYDRANYDYDQVKPWIAGRKARLVG